MKCTGTPEQVAKVEESYTGQFLKTLITTPPGAVCKPKGKKKEKVGV
jgi:hypothetical protein